MANKDRDRLQPNPSVQSRLLRVLFVSRAIGISGVGSYSTAFRRQHFCMNAYKRNIDISTHSISRKYWKFKVFRTISLCSPDLNRHCSASQQHQRERSQRRIINIFTVNICTRSYKRRYNFRRCAPYTDLNINTFTICSGTWKATVSNRKHSECNGVSPSLFFAFAFAPFDSKVDTIAATFLDVHTWMAL